MLPIIAAPAHAQDANASKEMQVKSVFIFNFINFVEWPEAKRTPGTTICTFGGNPFGDTLEYISSKKQGDKPSIVRHIANGIELAKNCHILFVADAAEGELPAIARYAAAHGILTVSDIGNFATRGGIVGFIRKDNKIRLQINPDMAAQAGLKISAKLLELSDIAKGGTP